MTTEQKHRFHPIQSTILSFEHMLGRQTSPEIVRDSLRYIRRERADALKTATLDVLKGSGNTLLGTVATLGTLGTIAVSGFGLGFGAVIIAGATGAQGEALSNVGNTAAYVGSVMVAATTYSPWMRWSVKKLGQGLHDFLAAPVRYVDTMHTVHKNARAARRSNSTYPLYYS